MSAPLPGDKKAGFTGLILGAIVLFAITWGIVKLTNDKFDAHSATGSTPAAQH